MVSRFFWLTGAALIVSAMLCTTAFAEDLKVGDRVSCNWKDGGKLYNGKVAELRAGGKIFIKYDDGDTEETLPGKCNLIAQTLKDAAVGARVSCNWKGGGKLYTGTVAEVRAGGKIFIHYDDGDKEETTPAMCYDLLQNFKVGDAVACNWKGGGKLYNGKVAELRAGGKIYIHYNDGDKEETTPEMCNALK